MVSASYLEIRHGAEVRQFFLTGDLVTIGRAPDNQLVLGDGEVARYHASLQWNGDNGWIIDLNSGRPTTVNGLVVPASMAVPVLSGDEIRIAGFLLRIGAPDARPEPHTLTQVSQPPASPPTTVIARKPLADPPQKSP